MGQLPALVGPDGATPLSSIAGPRSREVALDRPYRATSYTSQELANWRPGLTSADSAILPSQAIANARVEDIARDDPHARAGLDRRVDLLVGAGVRLVAQFDAQSLGLDRVKDADTIRDLRRQIEREWKLFAVGPGRWSDAARQVSLNGRFRQLARTWGKRGEVCAVLRWRESSGGRYRTCLQAIDPDRLSNPDGEPNTMRRRGGVEFDTMGAAVGYWVRNAHLADAWLTAEADAYTWTRIPRETPWGRPVFVHGFEPERENQSRAMTPFAALLQRLKMIGQFADTELAAATANAMFAATLESAMPVGDASAVLNVGSSSYADMRSKHYATHKPVFQGVRIPVLPPGDKLVMNDSPRQNVSFASFQTTFLRSIASSLGLSYEQLSMDWSQTNYSSARAALNEVWRGVRREFAQFCEQVIMPVYCAFLEEAFDRGYIVPPKGVPSFWDLPEAWCAARWIGSPRGYVDPVKEAQGAAIRLDNLTSTLESECAEQGLDFEDVLDQLEYEREELSRRGLQRASVAAALAGSEADKADEKDDDEKPTKRQP